MRLNRVLAAGLVGGLATLVSAGALAEDVTQVRAPAIDEPMQVGTIVDGRIVAAPKADNTLAAIEPAPPVPQTVRTFEQMRAAAPKLKVDEVCTIIREAAEAHRLPKPFLARLIWKESRFDTKAVSPVGALGIAQFMPGTAAQEGLVNPFDPVAAIHASAKHLADMRVQFGNLGLAAIGYNAGPGRAEAYMGGNDFLPRETENYVASILGRPAEDFAEGQTYKVAPLRKGLSFRQACRKLPVIRTRAPAGLVAARPSAKNMPWHVQVSRHFARHVAVNMYKRARKKHYAIIGKLPYAVVVERARAGLRDQKSVRVGANSRAAARDICARMKRNGGFCIVKRNRRG